MRRRKRRRKGAFRSSNDDELNLDDIVKTGMDDKLEDIVSKTNLTAINVKSILHVSSSPVSSPLYVLWVLSSSSAHFERQKSIENGVECC